MQAARALAGLDGYRDAGVDRLIAFADRPTLHSFYRLPAAESLAEVDGYQDHAARLLAQLPDHPTLNGSHRMAARLLARLGESQDQVDQILTQVTDDITLRDGGGAESDDGDIR